MVDAISFYKDAKIGTELSADADWKRRGLYIGPQVCTLLPLLPPFLWNADLICYWQFDTLDVGVQEEFEKYLNERGINESLALFIPEYAEYKEQKVLTILRPSHSIADLCNDRNMCNGLRASRTLSTSNLLPAFACFAKILLPHTSLIILTRYDYDIAYCRTTPSPLTTHDQ